MKGYSEVEKAGGTETARLVGRSSRSGDKTEWISRKGMQTRAKKVLQGKGEKKGALEKYMVAKKTRNTEGQEDKRIEDRYGRSQNNCGTGKGVKDRNVSGGRRRR